MMMKEIKNCMENWEEEEEEVKTNRQYYKFKLANKYMKIVVHDKEGGETLYGEIRNIYAIVWARSSKAFKVNTELLRLVNESDNMRNVKSN